MSILTEMAQRRKTHDTFGSVLRRIRQFKGRTAHDIARMIEDDFKSLPTRATIEKIADAMQCTPTEKAELLAAAGRGAEEMQKRPELPRLFRTAAQLPPSVLEELVQDAEARLKKQRQAQHKRREKDDASQSS